MMELGLSEGLEDGVLLVGERSTDVVGETDGLVDGCLDVGLGDGSKDTGFGVGLCVGLVDGCFEDGLFVVCLVGLDDG